MNFTTSLSALNANMGAFGIIATILAIIATVAAFLFPGCFCVFLLRRQLSNRQRVYTKSCQPISSHVGHDRLLPQHLAVSACGEYSAQGW